jgi:hypothetical protein
MPAVTTGQHHLVDSGATRNGLSEANLDVFAKLAEQRLKWGEEAEALLSLPRPRGHPVKVRHAALAICS